MEKKLLLLLTGCMLSLLCIAQEQSENSTEGEYDPYIVLLSRGIIYAKGNGNSTPSMYIGGSMRVNGDDRANATTYVENTRIKLTGDIINDNTSGNAFLNESPTGNGVYVPGVVEFCGTEQQMITTTGTVYDNSPTKKRNWIGFPGIAVNNSNHVLVDARMGVKTQDIDLTKGWLILDSRIADISLDDPDLDPDNQTVSAHLLVEGAVNYNSNTWASAATPEERGFIEVRLKVPTDGNANSKSVVGFGPPFKKLRADYFMFNTLLEPAWTYTTGEGFVANKSIINPSTVLEAGHGYALAIDVNGTDSDNYPPRYSGVSFDERAIDGYRFNRHIFTELAPSNQYHGSDVTAAAYQDETLNTEDISLTLQAGYNYLSNPYTCPLDISELIPQDDPGESNPGNNDYSQGVDALSWGIKVGVAENHPPVLNKVWILNPNSVVTPTNDIDVANYNITYQVAMNPGGTYTGGVYDGSYTGEYGYDNYENPDPNVTEESETLIAPLQMFLLRAYSTAKNYSFKIPKSERRIGGIPFLRSNSQPARSDDFIFEVRNVETKTTDRLSLVVRHEDELAKNGSYENVVRLEVASMEKDESLRSSTFDFTQKLGSQFYTKDASGTPLTVQFLPLESTNSIVLYHIPSSQQQTIQIVGLRMGTKDRVRYMWLEDRKEKTLTEVTGGMFYETVSSPGDDVDRFVLHFNEMTGVEEIPTQTTIYAYQEGSNIVVTGLTDSDRGNTLNIYDISGKLLLSKTVSGTKEYFASSHTGVYIIRMTGSRTQTVKLVAR